MFRRLIFLCFTFAFAVLSGAELQDDINRGAIILQEFPQGAFKDAQGIALLRVVKGGFLISGRGGRGLIIAKTADGWSAPSAIAIGGAGIGPQVGAEVTDFVMVLNTKEAVDSFAKGGKLSLGYDLSVAAGSYGKTEGGEIAHQPAVYTYSRTEGVFAGIALEGTMIVERKKANAAFYKKIVTAGEILSGKVPRPESAHLLYQRLEEKMVPKTSGFFSHNMIIGAIVAALLLIVLGVIYLFRRR